MLVFLATLSHELRQPLNAVLGWAKMIRDGQLTGERLMRALAVIERNAQVQVEMINDLLDVSRIVAGKLELQLGVVDPAKISHAAMDALRPQCEAKQITIEPLIEPEIGLIRADGARLQQVIWNLLSNAIKFSPARTTIQLRVSRVNSKVEISVLDHGGGIARDFLPRIFDRFSQAPKATSSQSGLGLGLAIVRHLVELHGGTVHAHSDGEATGACFTVRLPVEARGRALAHEPSDVARVETTIRLDGVQVLFADDNADARELVEAILTARGASVVTCGSKDAALTALERNRPHVLISDIDMPDGDGFELIRALRLRDEDTVAPIAAIAVTAMTRVEDRIRILTAGFQAHVPKPVDPSELVAAVAAVNSRRRSSGR